MQPANTVRHSFVSFLRNAKPKVSVHSRVWRITYMDDIMKEGVHRAIRH